MQNLYKELDRTLTWLLFGVGLWVVTASGVLAQVPSCGPNQLLTGYKSGATSVVSTTGTVTSAGSVIGISDGVVATLNANSGVVLDMGSLVSAGSSLVFSYYSVNSNAPLQVLVAGSAAGPYTNIAQLSPSTTETTSSVTLPLDTRYIQVVTTGTSYYVDAVTYMIYKCVNNPAPTCTVGQTLLTYPVGSQSVAATTGTVTSSSSALGISDGVVSTVNGNESITLDLGSVVSAGTVLSLAYYSQYNANSASPLPVLVSATGLPGSFTNVGSFMPTVKASNGTLTLPLDTRYVQLAAFNDVNSTYYIDALTYPLYACVSLPSLACPGGQQLVTYNTGATALGPTTGVTNGTNSLGVPDGTLASLAANGSLIVDMGILQAAGSTLTVSYQSANATAPIQIATASSVGGPYTLIGTMPGSTASTTGQITLPLDAQYIKLITTTTSYLIDAVTYPIYSCVTTPSTNCPAGQVSVSSQAGAQGGIITGTVTTSANAVGLPDAGLAGISANSSIRLDMGSTIPAGNQLNIYYKSANTTAPLQVLVATSAGGPFTNIAQLPASTTITTGSIVLPIEARYVQLQTTSTGYSVDAVTQTLYNCVVNPAACPSGQQSIAYPAGGAASVYSTTGTVSASARATGLPDAAYASLDPGATVTLDLGATAVAASTLTFVYNPASASTPMLVSVASSPSGPYTSVGTLPGDAAWATNGLILPVGARYVQVANPASAGTTALLDAITYTFYTCVTPISISCAAGQQSLSYEMGAQATGAITGSVTKPNNIVGSWDGVNVSMPTNAEFTVDMGSALPAGTVLTLYYTSDDANTPMQVFAANSSGGPFTFMGTVDGSTKATSAPLTLPVMAQYIKLKTTTTAYSPDAITYPVYTCASPPLTQCPTGQMLLEYTQGAVGTSGTTTGVTLPGNATDSPDGSMANLNTNATLTLDMGSTISAGNSLIVTYNSAIGTNPLQILVATSAGGPFTNIAQLPSNTDITTESIQLPLNARYVQLKTTATTYSVDAVTYPVYRCVTRPSTVCSGGQFLVSYPSGAQGIGAITGSVNSATSALGSPDATEAGLVTNASLILDMGSVVTAGNTLDITYYSANVTAPLQVLVATAAGGPYTNIAQLPGNTVERTVTLTLPLDAQYVQLQTTGTGYWVDAVTRTLYSCVASPVSSCSAGLVSSSYQAGIQAVGATTGSVTSPSSIIGVPDGIAATVNANASLIADMGSTMTAGTTVYVTYESANIAAPMQVLVASSAAGPFTNIAQLPGRVNLTKIPVTLPLSARYIQLRTSGTAYYPDAITFPVYTCIMPISSTCGTSQQSISYQAGAQTVGATTGSVTNNVNLTGPPDGAVGVISTNSSVILDLGTVVTGGNSLQITYNGTNMTVPLQVLIATSVGGPFTNIAQLDGSKTTTTETVNLPLDARYVQLVTTTKSYTIDAVTYPVYTCVNNPASICSAGQQVVSYVQGAIGVNGQTGVNNPSNGVGTPDGAYAAMLANAQLTLDLGAVIAGGNTLTLSYKSANLTAPMQVLVASNAGGPYTNIGQMPASTSYTTGSLTLPVDARYVQLQTDATPYSVDAVTHPVYNCVSSTITSGIVYADGDVNGVLNSTEQGLGGVIVKAYDVNGNLVATTTTSAGNPTLNIPAGYYSFNNLIAGQPYRLEFSNWPSPYSPSIYGPDNRTTEQFILGVTQNNNFGLYIPSTVCSFLPNPRLVTGKGLISGATTVESYQYKNAQTRTADIDYTLVGVPLGLASQRPNNLVYMSPISTNLPGVFPPAPDGSSAIYIANYNAPDGTQAYQGSKLLVKLSDLGIDVGSPSTSLTKTTFGVQGLGGMDFSQSGDTMFVVNMYKGTLVGVDVSQVDYTNLPATAPTSAFEIKPSASLANCSGGVYRPTALKQFGGEIYMGGVCDAEFSQNSADLKGVVLAYQPASQTWRKVFEYPIDFTAGIDIGTGRQQVGWTSLGENPKQVIQPVMLDLAFADNGEMIIGTTNRLVYGSYTWGQHGYVMGAWRNADGTYTLENGGKLGPYTSTVPNTTGSDGPGGKWFFKQSAIATHDYFFEGGLYIRKGTNEVVAGFTDPGAEYSYGMYYLDLSTGQAQYYTILGSGQKLTRITGTEQVCDAVPPIEIGNRVWKDTNSNGIQDAGEPSLAGVTVELRDANGNLVATAITDANGNYIFSNQPNLSDTPSQKYNLPITQLTNYTLRISSLGSDTSTAGLTLTGISPAPGETAGTTNTGATAINNDAFLINGLPTITLKSPVDGLINHNYDFGFIPTSFDLALTKKLATGQASVVKPGSNVTFTLTVINQGTQPAYSIQLTDYIPAGFTLNDASWNANGNLATLKTPISGSLAAGSSTTVTITFTVSSTTSGSIINKAEISSADNDTNPSNTPPTDVDSTPDQNPTNDAGGTPNSGSDNSINGNGKGVPGDTNPATDEDDEDPAIIYVQPCTLGVNLLTTEAHCGKSDGQATVTVNTGAAPFTYSWSTGASTSTITGLSGGQTFTVTVSDANGCQDVLVGTIQSTGGPSLTATAAAASCQQANGSATVTASGGTGSYSYLWSTGATTPTLSNVASGTYTVRVTDGAGCVSSLAVIVPANSPLSVVATPTSASCLGANGSITLSVSGGTAAYSYQWDNGATTQNLTAVAGGTYKVNITDAAGCTAVATAVVPNTGAPTVSGTPVNPLCFGTTTGSVALQVSGGSGAYSYQWDNGSTAQSLTNVQAGIYNVVVTDGAGCRSGGSFTLVAPSRIVADMQSLSAVCNAQGGVTGGTLQVVSVVGGTPGYSYLWSNSSTATSLTGLAAGTYSLTVTDSKGCVALGQAVIDPWPSCALASLGDYVWFDTNKNGQQDPTETGVANVTAVLYDAVSGTVVSTTLTDATGHYLFTNLQPGSYYVKFTTPQGYTYTTANSGADATDSDAGVGGQTGVYSLTAGQQDLTVDAGLIPIPIFDLALIKTLAIGQSANVVAGGTVTFTVTIYNQGNVDATNIQVTDYIPAGLTLNDASWTASGSTATLTTPIASLSAGQSTTRNIAFTVGSTFVGSLTNVAEISSAGNAQNLPDRDSTPDNNPGNDGTPVNDDTSGDHKNNPSQDEDDSDPEVITVSLAPVFDLALIKTLAPGQSRTVVAGGTVTFTVTVYNQGNVDATNVQVTDYIPAGLVLNDAAWTAGNGLATLNSAIAGLPAGQSTTRTITFTVSSTFVGGSLTNVAEISSAGNAQNLPDRDSTPDNNPGNDGTPVNDDTSGDHKNNPSQDEDDSDPEVITVTPLKAALGDYVWYDNNKNGQQDTGEPPAVGVTVTLYDAVSGTVVSTTLTDATGHYLFTNLNPGTYYVVFTAPSGATFTTVNAAGINDTVNSDAGVGGKTRTYTLVAGQTDLTVDAGLIPQCTSPNCGEIGVQQKKP